MNIIQNFCSFKKESVHYLNLRNINASGKEHRLWNQMGLDPIDPIPLLPAVSFWVSCLTFLSLSCFILEGVHYKNHKHLDLRLCQRYLKY